MERNELVQVANVRAGDDPSDELWGLTALAFAINDLANAHWEAQERIGTALDGIREAVRELKDD